MSNQTKAAQEVLWRLRAHIDDFETIRTDMERQHRARVRQWQKRYWLVHNAHVDDDGVETVKGYDSTYWNTDLDGYLSTDTHQALDDSGYWAHDPHAPGDEPSHAHSNTSNGSVFIDDGDSNSSHFEGSYSPASLDVAASDGYDDLTQACTSPFHTSPQPPGNDQGLQAADADAHEPTEGQGAADGDISDDDADAPPHVHDSATATTTAAAGAPAADTTATTHPPDASVSGAEPCQAAAPSCTMPGCCRPPRLAGALYDFVTGPICCYECVNGDGHSEECDYWMFGEAADEPPHSTQPSTLHPSNDRPPPSGAEPDAKRARDDERPARPAQAAPRHLDRPEPDRARSPPRPAPPAPHPDIQPGPCTTQGCDRPALFTNGPCCQTCQRAAAAGATPCHSPECDSCQHAHTTDATSDTGTTGPALPTAPAGTDSPAAALSPEEAPPHIPPPPPTPSPNRTPTPTPTPPPPTPDPREIPHPNPPQQSPAPRHTPCPLLWCLLVGISALACLPTDSDHRTQGVRHASMRRPGPAASSVMIGLLAVLGAGAAPRALSAPCTTCDAVRSWAAHNDPTTCPAHAAPSPSTDPHPSPAPAPQPPWPPPQSADPAPADLSTGARRANWSIAGLVLVAILVLAHPYIASAADSRQGPHQRPHRHQGTGASAGAASAGATPREPRNDAAAGSSDQPLEVYPHHRAQQSDDMVATSRSTMGQPDMHATRSGAHAARARRGDGRLYVANDRRADADGASAGSSDAGADSDGSDADAKAKDREVYELPLYVLGCCISATDEPPGDFMHPDATYAHGTPTSAGAAATHGQSKRRRVPQVVTHHQAVSLAITVWRLVRDDTGVYYTKEEVIAVQVGLPQGDTFSLAPLTANRGQILCMVMATRYARLFRRLRHAIVLSKYTSHHVAIRNGTGATQVDDIAAGVQWLADQYEDDPHHIGSGTTDCVGRFDDGHLIAATILDVTTSHIRRISNTNARGTEYAELTVSALECCDHFGEPRIQEAIRAWRTEQPDNRTHHLHSAAATATAAPNTVTPVRAHPARGADDDDDDSLGARPEGARAEAASPLAAPLRKRARTPAASPDGSDSSRPVPHSGAQRPRTAQASASASPQTPSQPTPAAAAATAAANAPPVAPTEDDGGGETEEEQI